MSPNVISLSLSLSLPPKLLNTIAERPLRLVCIVFVVFLVGVSDVKVFLMFRGGGRGGGV